MKRKKTLVLIVIICFASFALVFLEAKGFENFVIRKRNIQQLKEYNKSYELMDKQDAENMDLLFFFCEYLLTNEETSLESRYAIAKFMSSLYKTDLPILYLISYEMTKIFSGQITPYHHGFLITIDNKAILLEHGFSLYFDKNTDLFLEELSKDYSWILLAACDSNYISEYYTNVYGFKGEITVQDVFSFLSKKLDYNCDLLNNVFDSSIKSFELDVSPAIFGPGFSLWIGLEMISALNFALGYTILDQYHISLEIGDGSWGATHINGKVPDHLYLNNWVLAELLQSKTWFFFKSEYYGLPDQYFKLVVFKKDIPLGCFPASAGGKGARMTWALIGLPGINGFQPPGIYGEYTIRTAGIYGVRKTEDPTPQPEAERLLNKYIEPHECDPNDIIHRNGYDKNKGFQLGPKKLSEIPTDQLLGIISEEPPQDIQNINYREIFSNIFLTILVIAILLAAVVTFAPSGGSLSTVMTALAFGIIFGLGIWTAPITFVDAALPPFEGENWDDYPDENDMNILESDGMNNYDDDNDGISNVIEGNYFECYYEDYFGEEHSFSPGCELEEGLTIDDKYTWLDPYDDNDNDGLLTMTEILYGSDPFQVDTDGDGLDDNEELIYLGTTQDVQRGLTDYDRDNETDTQTIPLQEISIISNPAAFDSDHDGLGDKEEDTLGLNPYNPDSDGDTLLDGWEVYTYAIKWKDSPDEDYSYYKDYVDPIDDPISNWAAQDLDGDNLNNTIESRLFTNPYSTDTDNDGLSDDWEYENNLDPTDARDADYDHDTDGLTTLNEAMTYQTSLLLEDTDDDGWTDLYEVNVSNTDPLLNDTDCDGLLDVEEYNYWNNRGLDNTTAFSYCNNTDVDNDDLLDGEEVNIYLTDPLDDDCDNDNALDSWEILTYGTDPWDYDTDDDGIGDYAEITGYNTDPLDADTDDDNWNDSYEIYTSGTDPTLDDTDNDGLIDSIEQNYNTNPLDSDSDNDGLLDGEEVNTYFTDPTKDDTDFDGLEDLEEVTTGSDGYITDPNDSDSDNDGLYDGQEDTYNTNPNDPDHDNDGWNDGFEVNTSGTNPKKADTDSDGLTDKNEYNYWKYTRGRTTSQAYAYCKDSDVDNDNLEDGAELALGCDPLDNDTDNDGLYDGSEDLYYDTDPTDYDSDNDGYSDGEEVAAGSDPNDPNDTPGGGGFGW